MKKFLYFLSVFLCLGGFAPAKAANTPGDITASTFVPCLPGIDVGAAVNAGIIKASSAGGGNVVLGPGTCRIDTYIVMKSNVTLSGSGVDSTLIDCSQGTRTLPCIYHIDGTNVISNVTLEDFKIKGDWVTTPDQNGAALISMYYTNNLKIQNIEAEYARYFSISGVHVNGFNLQNIYVHDGSRDFVTFEESSDGVINNLRCVSGGDDCLALHNQNTASFPVRGGIAISNVYMADVFGIDQLGNKVTSINSVVGRRMKGYCYKSGFSSAEGQTASIGPSLTGFDCTDVINPGIFGYLSVTTYYALLGSFAQAGSGTLPFRSDGTTVVQPWDYDWTDSNGSGTATISPGHGLVLSGFTFSRTLAATSAYSSWGFDPGTYCGTEAFSPSGCVDPAVTDDDLSGACIGIYSGLTHALISQGFCMAGNFGILGVNLNGVDYAVDNVTFDGLKIVNSIGGGFELGLTGATKENVIIKNSEFENDPFFLATGHNSDGTWNNGLTQTGCIDSVFLSGLIEGGNIFKNCFQGIRSNSSTVLQQIAKDTYYGQAVAPNYNSSNVGIGDFAPGEGYVAVNQAGNSTSYGTYLGSWPLHSSSIPTSGYHITGQFVSNDSAVCSANVITLGWTAVTTGNSNTSGTDISITKGSC